MSSLKSLRRKGETDSVELTIYIYDGSIIERLRLEILYCKYTSLRGHSYPVQCRYMQWCLDWNIEVLLATDFESEWVEQ